MHLYISFLFYKIYIILNYYYQLLSFITMIELVNILGCSEINAGF